MSSTNTSKLGLYKATPGTQEPANIALYNANFDTLDNAATLTGSQTLTNKTMASQVLSGGSSTAGVLGYATGALQVGDGSGQRALNISTWTTFTPTLFQLAGVASSVGWARYTVVGKLAIVQIRMIAGAAGTSGNAIEIASIDSAVALKQTAGADICGVGLIQHAGTLYACTASPVSASVVKFYTGANTDAVGVAPAFALANTDVVSAILAYEIA